MVVVGLLVGLLLSALLANRAAAPFGAFAGSPTAVRLAGSADATGTAQPTSDAAPTLTVELTIARPAETPTPIAGWVNSTLAAMTTEQKVGQLIMTGVTGTMAHCSQIQTVQPGAVIYLEPNAEDADQLRDLSAGLQACAQQANLAAPLLVAIDHEGEFVYRFQTRSQVTEFPMAMAVGQYGDSGSAYWAARASGSELRYAGVNMVLGPVADVLRTRDGWVDWLRTFGGDPNYVASFVSAATRGYLDVGLIPVLKHFPGHGTVAANSHIVKPIDTSSLDLIHSQHLVPFEAGLQAGAQAIMMSHVAYTALDPSQSPASLSQPIIDGLLRGEMGFDGFIITDSMSMGAITTSGYSVPRASIRAISAGVDMVMVINPQQAIDTYNSLLGAVNRGDITSRRLDDAVRHILTLKVANGLTGYPVQQGWVPDWAGDAQLSAAIGHGAIALVRNEAGLVPLPPDRTRVMIIAPRDVTSLDPPDDGGLIEPLRAWFEAQDRQVTAIPYDVYNDSSPMPPFSAIQEQAVQQDVVIVMTWDSHLREPDQQGTVRGLLGSGVPVIIVALRSPYDLVDYRDAQTYIVTFGTTKGQLQGLIDGLTGQSYLNAPRPQVVPLMP